MLLNVPEFLLGTETVIVTARRRPILARFGFTKMRGHRSWKQRRRIVFTNQILCL